MAKTRSPRGAKSVVIGRTTALWALLGVQAVSAIFFLVDSGGDLLGFGGVLGGVLHYQFELMAVVALAVSLVFTIREIRLVLIRQRRVEAQLRAASGAFLALLEEHFEKWSLTPSEQDVAWLAIKGCSIAEIARLRHTKEGTVKAQCNAIYTKAGVTGRPQLLSLFIDELLGDGVLRQPSERP